MSSVISDKHFHDERAAYAYVEARIWPDGPVCPHCGNADPSRMKLFAGKSTRLGVRQCNECRKPFTVKIGTIFESSHVPLRIWLQAIHMICSSKKGISSNQLHRTFGVTLKTAWFMSHRLREAMRSGDLAPMGGAGSIVEADETFIGRREDSIIPSRPWSQKCGAYPRRARERAGSLFPCRRNQCCGYRADHQGQCREGNRDYYR